MDEIREVEIELRRLREEAEHGKSEVKALQKENTLLKSRNEYLANKLKEASYVYGEAGKRLLYFINNQVNPVVERLNKLESGSRKLGSEDKMLGESIVSLEKSLNGSLEKANAKMTLLADNLGAAEEKLSKAIKGAVKKMDKGDAATAEMLGKAQADYDGKLEALKDAVDRKIAAKLAAQDKSVNGKVSMLRERNLLLGKDIEAIMKFETDIGGLEGRLQETIGNLSQTKLDMEKLESRVKAAMTRTGTGVGESLKKLSDDLDKKILSFSSELRRIDEKNLAETRQQLEGAAAAQASFERKVVGKVRKAESVLKSELGSTLKSMEERMRMLEKGIDANGKNHKDSERAVLDKISSLDSGLAAVSSEVQGLKRLKSKLSALVKQAEGIDQRIGTAEASVTDNIESFKDRFERNRIIIKNELEKIDKKIDERVRQASSELVEQNSASLSRMREEFLSDINSARSSADLLSKDVARLKSMTSDIKALAAGIGKLEETNAAMQERLDSISKETMGKSEMDDMRLKKQIDVLKSEIKSGMEAFESRLSKENVKAFSAARHSLKGDIHAVREENAALKAEVKGLHSLAATVGGLQKDVMAIDKKIEDFGHTIDNVSAATTSRLENEALKVSKDMAGIAARLKSDLREMISSEKVSFGKQSAGLDSRFESLQGSVQDVAKGLEEQAGRLASSSESSTANKRQLAQLDKKLNKVLGEISGWKKEYKLELDRLLKEIEG